MLTVRQLYFPLVSFQICSKIGLLPLVIDVKTGHIRRQTSKKIWHWWCFLLVLGALLHGGFATGQLIAFFSSSDEKPIEELPLLINFFIFLAGLYMFPTSFVWHNDVAVATFNSLFQGNNLCNDALLINSSILF